MDLIEYIPTPDEFMGLMDSGMNFKVVPSIAHRMYYVYPMDDDALFTANVMGLVDVNAPGSNRIASLTNAMGQWQAPMKQAEFQAWRDEFNRSGERFIPNNK